MVWKLYRLVASESARCGVGVIFILTGWVSELPWNDMDQCPVELDLGKSETEEGEEEEKGLQTRGKGSR